ncbi:hypothetical protein NDU88_001075 [Pleurodeles waltl]|uniref:Uncharacterized protein n=1 Tax=Pleurodeles waltl TaxID=8319 RepID=A0AAV7U5I1_PLEWA|nr:hypothetical protein NDU88_001075 [Pleurodeles waltl]
MYLMKDKLDKQEDRLREAEIKISTLEDVEPDTKATLNCLKKEFTKVTAKSEDLESLLCRNNIGIVGLLEITNMGKHEIFVESPSGAWGMLVSHEVRNLLSKKRIKHTTLYLARLLVHTDDKKQLYTSPK